MLRGGLAEWNDEVLHPVLVGATTAEQRRQNEERAAVAAFFGGTPRTEAPSSSSSAPAVVAPQVVRAPAAPTLRMPNGGAKPIPAKKKEGC